MPSSLHFLLVLFGELILCINLNNNGSAIVWKPLIKLAEDPYKVKLTEIYKFAQFPDIGSKITKIIGGNKATKNSFPFQTALFIQLNDKTSSFCGGSLISPNYVLTAAHCITNPSGVLIVLGASDLSINEVNQIRQYAKRYLYHSHYNPNNLQNDIAILQLPQTIRYTAVIRPVELPTYSQASVSYENILVTAIGWGKTSDVGNMSSGLRYLNTRTITQSSCHKTYGNIVRSQICTNGLGGTGTCNGDSGGPLIYGSTQIGIVSFGGKSCSAGYPAVFTRVSSYLDWISMNTDVKIKQ